MLGLPPLRLILDPRTAHEAQVAPLADTVNIPTAELEARMHELPPRHVPLQVASVGEATVAALAWLTAGGRDASPISCAAGPGLPGRLWRPNAWLEEASPSLPPGRAVDLGCGSGREAVALAAGGWRVKGIDRLEDALTKARNLEMRTLGCSRIVWVCADMEAEGFALDTPVDLILSFAYLHRPLFSRAAEWLAPGGHLLVETFTTVHRERFGKPRTPRFVLEPGELVSLAQGLEVLHHSEEWREDGRHTARLLAGKSV